MNGFIIPAFLTILLFNPLPSHAAEKVSVLPPELRRLWVSPSCDNVKSAFLFTGRFALHASGNGNLLYRFRPVLRHENIYRFGIADFSQPSLLDEVNKPFDLKLTPDGRLVRYDLPLFVEESAGNPFDQERYLLSYSPCTDFTNAYTYLDKDGLAAIRALDRVDAVCGTVPIQRSPACRQTVFEVFDGDRDQSLSRDELDRAYRNITYAGASMGCDLALYFPAATATEGPLFADGIIKAADHDADQKITLAELEESWPGVAAQKYFKKLGGFLGNLSTMLGFLPAGTPLPDCICAPARS